MAVSPLDRSEVQKSSSGTLFGKAVAASSSSHLFGKPITSVASSTEGLFGKASSSSVSSGLFGKAPPMATSSGQGVGGGTFSSDGGSLFSKQPQKSLFGKSTEPQSSQFGRSEAAASNADSQPGGKFLFGKPVEKMEPSSTTSIVKEEASLFGKPRKEEPLTLAQQPVSSTRMLFGKPIAPLEDIPDTGDVKSVPTKNLFGKAGPVGSRTGSALWAGHQGGSGSKRPLIEMEEEGEGRGEDLSDLESFGSRKRQPADEIERKSIIKRSSLFGRALEDVQGKSKKRRSDGDEGPKQRRSSLSERHHTASPEEIKEIKSIVCKGIPSDLNLRGILVDIFQEYGEVTKVSCHPDIHSAIIYFADHESAARAKRKVSHLKRGTRPVSIFWARSQSKSSRTEKGKSKLPVSSRVPAQTERPSEKRTLSPSKRPESSRHTDATPTFSAFQQKQSLSSITAALQALEGKIAHSASDRLDILEERDKLKRQERAIVHGTGTMPALVGECEDMCPEKERYMREFQRRLSMYEVENVGAREQRVCHPAAVKEYSRSSADQELPLPSDLRPPEVLVMTMDYIMNNILDKGVGEDNHSWGEWYTFLWDRTRSLRKDITQQQLCDKTAVSLLEKCTRFHIFCAHRLCEEDLSAFDPKINSENLTKCLQSLKHLYDDLSDKDILCENEAEFRAYDVLLNLNQGDILR
ncbi:Germinal-center associated nuclear protein [Holothuria leucospilota]|uniref:Germinal-center associated nuclear protein n=1 Tax=Holothuria leucospilota TaxID=206669 RepID=A0A9Q0YGK9_HOLLE|nr:Germinal-center associated nuclear protein [Holothuria leucospilota]